MFQFHCLSLFTNLCWLVILIPMIICLIVIYYLFGFTMIYSVCEYGWFKMVKLKWLNYLFIYFTLLLLLIIDIMYVASALRILSDLCWFESLILIEICLIDICFFTADQCMLQSVLGYVSQKCSCLSCCSHYFIVLCISIVDRFFYPYLI